MVASFHPEPPPPHLSFTTTGPPSIIPLSPLQNPAPPLLRSSTTAFACFATPLSSIRAFPSTQIPFLSTPSTSPCAPLHLTDGSNPKAKANCAYGPTACAPEPSAYTRSPPRGGGIVTAVYPWVTFRQILPITRTNGGNRGVSSILSPDPSAVAPSPPPPNHRYRTATTGRTPKCRRRPGGPTSSVRTGRPIPRCHAPPESLPRWRSKRVLLVCVPRGGCPQTADFLVDHEPRHHRPHTFRSVFFFFVLRNGSVFFVNRP